MDFNDVDPAQVDIPGPPPMPSVYEAPTVGTTRRPGAVDVTLQSEETDASESTSGEAKKEKSKKLDGKKVAFLAADGVEQVELDKPWQAVKDAGAQAELISVKGEEIQAFHHHDKGDVKTADKTLSEAKADDYDALVLPGGVINGDLVRADRQAVDFAKSFMDAGKPVAGICHGLWVLAEADVVRDRTMTSWPSLATDLRNAGANWVDREVVTDKGLVTSRKPDDLPAFCAKLIEEIQEGVHRRPTPEE